MGYRSPYKIENRKVRFAVVGCGRIYDRHFDALKTHSERAELVAVCDSDRAALEKTAETLAVEGYESIEALLSKSEADVAVLCTPSGLHPAQAVQLARGGRHVVTEKPMAVTQSISVFLGKRWTCSIGR